MSNQLKQIIKTAKSIDEAVESALKELNISSDEAIINVLEEPKSGFFGIGARMAKVEVSAISSMDWDDEIDTKNQRRTSAIKNEVKTVQKSQAPKLQPSKPAQTLEQTKETKKVPQVVAKGEKIAPKNQAPVKTAPKVESKPPIGENAKKLSPAMEKISPKAVNANSNQTPSEAPAQNSRQSRPFRGAPRRIERPSRGGEIKTQSQNGYESGAQINAPSVNTPVVHRERAPRNAPTLSFDEACGRASEFLTGLLKDMGIESKLEATEVEGGIDINLVGENMGIVIGKRGDTLDAISYLTSLVVNRGEEGYTKINIDTENYRQKRSDALIKLAERLAQKVVTTGKKYTLEPMSPYERRVIHASLQNDPKVDTYSVGEEPYRKVVIVLKKD